MADAALIHVKVIDPNRVVFEGDTEYILAPGRRGVLGILPNHTPMFAELVMGDLYLAKPNEQVLPIDSGIMKVRGDDVVILIGLNG
jgi:F-type H+-transporting ATPase subunit epsilon